MASPILNVNVVADTKKFSSGLKNARGDLDGFNDGLKKLGIAAGVAFAAAGAALVAFSASAIKAASDLKETEAAVGEIFDTAAGGLKEFAKEAPKLLGQTQNQFLNATKTFGIFGKAAGLAAEENAEFSKKLAILAADLASFNNTSVDDAITALGAALRGESEPIRRYGVLLDDATLKAKAMELGIYDGNGALTQQQRVLAANAAILEQTSTQQGDFARTSDGAANATKILEASLDNLKITVGEALLPAVEAVIPAITDFVEGLQSNPEFNAFVQELGTQFTNMVPDLLTSAENLLRLSVEVLPGLNPAMEILGDVANIAAVALGNVSVESGNAFKDLENLSIVVGAISGFFEDFDGWLKETQKSLGAWGPFFKGVIDNVLTGLNPLGALLDRIVPLIQYLTGDRIGALKSLGYNLNVGADERRQPMPRLAEGGLVMPRPGGVPVTVAEAGQPEVVIPLNKLGNFGGGGTNITIQGNVGWSPEDLANIIMRKQRQAMALQGLNGIVGVR